MQVVKSKSPDSIFESGLFWAKIHREIAFSASLFMIQ
jgi:hypothetical protein